VFHFINCEDDRKIDFGLLLLVVFVLGDDLLVVNLLGDELSLEFNL